MNVHARKRKEHEEETTETGPNPTPSGREQNRQRRIPCGASPSKRQQPWWLELLVIFEVEWNRSHHGWRSSTLILLPSRVLVLPNSRCPCPCPCRANKRGKNPRYGNTKAQWYGWDRIASYRFCISVPEREGFCGTPGSHHPSHRVTHV